MAEHSPMKHLASNSTLGIAVIIKLWVRRLYDQD